jgi:hypothetical protein
MPPRRSERKPHPARYTLAQLNTGNSPVSPCKRPRKDTKTPSLTGKLGILGEPYTRGTLRRGKPGASVHFPAGVGPKGLWRAAGRRPGQGPAGRPGRRPRCPLPAVVVALAVLLAAARLAVQRATPAAGSRGGTAMILHLRRVAPASRGSPPVRPPAASGGARRARGARCRGAFSGQVWSCAPSFAADHRHDARPGRCGQGGPCPDQFGQVGVAQDGIAAKCVGIRVALRGGPRFS